MAGNIAHLSLYRRLACEVESSLTSQTCEKSLLVSKAANMALLNNTPLSFL